MVLPCQSGWHIRRGLRVGGLLFSRRFTLRVSASTPPSLNRNKFPRTSRCSAQLLERRRHSRIVLRAVTLQHGPGRGSVSIASSLWRRCALLLEREVDNKPPLGLVPPPGHVPEARLPTKNRLSDNDVSRHPCSDPAPMDFECAKCGQSRTIEIAAGPMKSNSAGWLSGELKSST